MKGKYGTVKTPDAKTEEAAAKLDWSKAERVKMPNLKPTNKVKMVVESANLLLYDGVTPEPTEFARELLEAVQDEVAADCHDWCSEKLESLIQELE